MSETCSIAFLAPKGTYCGEAAQVFADLMQTEYAQLVPFPSFNEIYNAVLNGVCEYGVMALENSLEGPVTSTLDTFAFRSGVTILGSYVMDIHHSLFVNPNSKMEDIDTIASHPQALGQCRHYLDDNYPGYNLLTVSSTADSARRAKENADVAAIASNYAGNLYGLTEVDSCIEDHKGNQTQFVLIAKEGHPPVLEGNNIRTSIALFLKEDKPGALLMILSEFSFAGVNMTRIQSRPTKQGLGSYMFFVDIEGSQEDESIATALACLRLKLDEVKILGTYPIIER